MNGIVPPKWGTSMIVIAKKFKHPTSGVQLLFESFPGLTNALTGHCEPWATIE